VTGQSSVLPTDFGSEGSHTLSRFENSGFVHLLELIQINLTVYIFRAVVSDI
jgi:hypothetical protein